MITQPPHFTQAPGTRQNLHINTQLIKNNYQTPISHRQTQVSPPPFINPHGVSFTPIEMTNNLPHDRNNVIISKPIQQAPMPMHFSFGNKMIAPPGPTTVAKMENVNRSNSSSRIFSQHSRVQYINVNGQSGNIINFERNSVSPPLHQVRKIEDQKVFYPPNMRPASNVSNNSSNSRNSYESRPIQNIPLTLIQNKSVENKNVLIHPPYGNKKPISPSRLVPSQPPANILNPYLNSQAQSPRNTPIKAPNIVIQPPSNNKTIDQQTNGARSLNMHTSDVKIIYQRGSYSPNSQHSSNQGEQHQYDNPSRQHIHPHSNNNLQINQGYLNQYQIQAPKKISISDLKQKQNEPAPITKNINLKQQSKQIIQKVQPTSVQSIFIQQLRSNADEGQDLLAQDNKISIRYQQQQQQNHKPTTPPQLKTEKTEKQSSLYRQQPIKQTQSRNIPQLQTSIDQPLKIYKSYDEYLAQTKKPDKIIQQIQQSQLTTNINIEYKLASGHKNTNKNIQKYTNSNKQMNIYQSIPIPQLYGNEVGDYHGSSNLSKDGSYELVHDVGSDNAKSSIEFYGSDPNSKIQSSIQPKQYIPPINIKQNNNINTTPAVQQQLVKQATNPIKLGKISTIKQQSQQYHDHDHDNISSYNSSSSLIGSSLQDNLQQLSHNPNNKQLSQYEPDSWSNLKYEQIDKYQNMPTSTMYRNKNDINLNENSMNSMNGKNGSNFRGNSIDRYESIGGFGNNGITMQNKINPFVMIQQQTNNKQYATDTTKPIQQQPNTINNNTNTNQPASYKYLNTANYQNTDISQNNKIISNYTNINTNQHSNYNSINDYAGSIPNIPHKITNNNKQGQNITNNDGNNRKISQPDTENNHHYTNQNIHNNNNTNYNQHSSNNYNNNNSSKVSIHTKQHNHPQYPPIIQQTKYKQQDNIGYKQDIRQYSNQPSAQFNRQHDGQYNNANMNYNQIIRKNKSYTNQDSNQKNISTKDRIASQKIIHTSHHHQQQHPISNRYKYSQHYIHHTHNNKHIQNQQQLSNQQPSIDVYQLIDQIYNKQLQNGLIKIRQVFGHAMVGIGYDSVDGYD